MNFLILLLSALLSSASLLSSVLSAEGRGKIKSQYHSPFHQPSATADKATHQLSLPPTACAPSISLSSITLSCTLVNGDVKSGEILFSSSFSTPPPHLTLVSGDVKERGCPIRRSFCVVITHLCVCSSRASLDPSFSVFPHPLTLLSFWLK